MIFHESCYINLSLSRGGRPSSCTGVLAPPGQPPSDNTPLEPDGQSLLPSESMAGFLGSSSNLSDAMDESMGASQS
jgi:hypothetical protein